MQIFINKNYEVHSLRGMPLTAKKKNIRQAIGAAVEES
jgi:hypothetical protein